MQARLAVGIFVSLLKNHLCCCSVALSHIFFRLLFLLKVDFSGILSPAFLPSRAEDGGVASFLVERKTIQAVLVPPNS